MELTEFGERLVEIPGGKGLRGGLHVRASVPADVDGAAVVDFRSSDETLDRYNEIVTAGGWRLENYRKNPVVQNSHSYWNVIDTIGKSLVTEVRGVELYQRVEFAVKENPFAKIAHALYKGGFLHAVSVGFIPIKWENGGDKAGYRRKYLEQELLEVSAVSVPANPNALQLAIKSGAVDKSDVREMAQMLKNLCDEKTGSAADVSPTGDGTNVGQLQVLARDVAEFFRVARKV